MSLKRYKVGANGHWYKLDGRKVDGVTTVIKEVMTPNLAFWAARLVAEAVADEDPHWLEGLRAKGRDAMVDHLAGIPTRHRNALANRGTEVHRYAERLVLGEAVEPPDELAGHVYAAVDFLNHTRIAPVLTESVVASRRHRYAGTLDLVADFPDGRRAILDYKTSGRAYPEAALQLAAYRYADIYLDESGATLPMEALGINCAYVVLLSATGYELIPVDTSEAVFGVFVKLAELARLLRDKAEWIGEAEDWRPSRAVAA